MTLVFPTLSGQDISFIKKPTFSTIVAPHISGREVRDALYQNPIWQFEVSFNALDSSPDNIYGGGVGSQSLQAIMGLFLACQGQYSPFLFTDPTDNAVTAGEFATGDGVTTVFTMARYLGTFLEPVGWVTSISEITVGGSVVGSSTYSLTTPNTLTFTTPPANGGAVAGTFAYAFLCRFDDDAAEFEQFTSQLWNARSVKFKSLRAS